MRTAAFAAVLLFTMAMSSLSFYILVVASSELESEFALSNLQLGLIGTFSTASGAAISPVTGRITDRIGAVQSLRVVLLVAAAGAAITASANSFEMVLVGMFVAGISAGMANPATNRAIASHVVSDLRGIITGIKQSGIQIAVVIAGFAVPAITALWGWRSGQWGMAALSILMLGSLWLVPEAVPTNPSSEGADVDQGTSPGQGGRSSLAIRTAVYGALLGTVGGGMGRFLPLYAEQVLDLSLADAGRIFGLSGLLAIPVRILSGISIDRGVSPKKLLVAMSTLGLASIALIAAADTGPNSLVFVGAGISGMTLGSWNTAANYIMIREPDSGKATGLLYLGFFTGLSIGGPLMGWSLDTFESYNYAWLGCAVIAVVASVIVSRDRGSVA